VWDVGILCSLLPLLAWGRDEFLSSDIQERWKILELLPHWHWWVWVVVFLSLLLPAVLEASYRVIRDQEVWVEGKILRMAAELHAAVAKHGRPEVVVTCDWPSAVSTNRTKNSGELLLKVLSDIPAMDVCIYDIEFPQEIGTAKFEVVRLLEKSEPKTLPCRVETVFEDRKKGHTTRTRMTMEGFIKRAYEVLPLNDLEIPPIRIIAHYKDSHGRGWESVNELNYDTFIEAGDMKLIEIRPITKPRS
ncbi:MAG: hypothetical protein WCD43_15740, partial [Candidatus Acidiferrales bacterium]